MTIQDKLVDVGQLISLYQGVNPELFRDPVARRLEAQVMLTNLSLFLEWMGSLDRRLLTQEQAEVIETRMGVVRRWSMNLQPKLMRIMAANKFSLAKMDHAGYFERIERRYSQALEATREAVASVRPAVAGAL